MLAPEHHDQAAIKVPAMVRVLRVTKAIVPGTRWLQKACQREYGTADILLHPHLFCLDHTRTKGQDPKLLGLNSIK